MFRIIIYLVQSLFYDHLNALITSANILLRPQCLIISQKVSFCKICERSEANYLTGQKRVHLTLREQALTYYTSMLACVMCSRTQLG